MAAAIVDRDAEAAAVALAGWTADALPALGAADEPLRAIGIGATLMVRKAGVSTWAGARRTAAEEATAPNIAAVAEPVAAPGARLVG